MGDAIVSDSGMCIDGAMVSESLSVSEDVSVKEKSCWRRSCLRCFRVSFSSWFCFGEEFGCDIFMLIPAQRRQG